MSFSFNDFQQSIRNNACGVTLDWQRQESGDELCQWLWGRPVVGVLAEKTEEELLALASEISNLAEQANLIAVDPKAVGMNLPNEIAILPNCPFRPKTCLGRHIAASGTSRIST